MANKDILTLLDTKGVADRFSDFLASQGLGDMNPSTAGRYRQGVEVSPMDNILLLNGLDLEALFERKIPETPPLQILSGFESDQTAETNSFNTGISAIKSIGLSEGAQKALSGLIGGGEFTSVDEIPQSLRELLIGNPGITNAAELIQQLGELSLLIGDTPLPDGKNLLQIMGDLMRKLKTNNTNELISILKSSSSLVNDALRDDIIGIDKPLGITLSMIRFNSVFDNDPLTGTPIAETLVANRSGASRLIGGGGADFFVIPLTMNPLAPKTTIEDFDSTLGSKIVLDLSDYKRELGSTIKFSKNSRTSKKLMRSKSRLFYQADKQELIINANGKKRGLGANGGVVATLMNTQSLSATDVLLFRENNLWQLTGELFNPLV